MEKLGSEITYYGLRCVQADIIKSRMDGFYVHTCLPIYIYVCTVSFKITLIVIRATDSYESHIAYVEN